MKSHSILRFFTGFIVALFGLVSLSANASPKGAVCIIKSNAQIVMVKETLTGKWSLPGGLINQEEEPAVSAQREAWEEVGLVVSANKELLRNDKAIYFDCLSDSEIVAFSEQDNAGGYPLPIWFAPHYAIEVSQARLIDPNDLRAEDYRYPEHWAVITSIMPNATSQPVRFIDNLIEAAPSFQQHELLWIANWQGWMSGLPSLVESAFEVLLTVGVMFTSGVWLVLLPFFYAQFGRELTLKLGFTLLFGYVLVNVAQFSFQLPRPFAYFPAIGLDPVAGYSMPNLAVTLWAIAFSVLLPHLPNSQRRRVKLAGGLLLAWLAMSLFYVGNAFLLDSALGLILGWLCGWHINRLDKTIGVESHKLFSQKGIWLTTFIAATMVAIIWQTQAMISGALVAFALLVVVAVVKLPTQIDAKFSAMWAGIGLLLCAGFALLAAQVDSSSFVSLLVSVSVIPMVIFVSGGLLNSKA